MMDAKKLNEILVSMLPGLLADWLPGGKLSGREYKCSDLNGGNGS